MRTTTPLSPSTARIIASAAVCAAAATLIAATTALAIATSGLAEDARRLLRLTFHGLEHSPTEAAHIGVHNARLAAGTLLCAAARPRIPALLRLALDLLLASMLAINAGVVGLALGAYGGRVATAIGLHAPFELAALSLAGGTYLQAREKPVGLTTLASVAAVCALLLAAAAALEAYASLGGLP